MNTTNNTTKYIYIKSTYYNNTLKHIHNSKSKLYIKFTTNNNTSKKKFTISYQNFKPTKNHTKNSKSNQSTTNIKLFIKIINYSKSLYIPIFFSLYISNSFFIKHI